MLRNFHLAIFRQTREHLEQLFDFVGVIGFRTQDFVEFIFPIGDGIGGKGKGSSGILRDGMAGRIVGGERSRVRDVSDWRIRRIGRRRFARRFGFGAREIGRGAPGREPADSKADGDNRRNYCQYFYNL